MVLIWMGFTMLRGNSSPTSAESKTQEGDEAADPSLTPLILFAASPGTIIGVITIAIAHSIDNIPVTALVAVVVALTVTWLIMVLMAQASGQQQRGMMHDVTSRFMGLIVLAMGVQFALTGLNEFFYPK